jgi:chromosomal replication initiator protein
MSQNFWQTCLQHLERELPADDFNTWVGPLQVAPQGRTVLPAPNEYVRDYIALNCSAHSRHFRTPWHDPSSS